LQKILPKSITFEFIAKSIDLSCFYTILNLQTEVHPSLAKKFKVMNLLEFSIFGILVLRGLQ